MKIRTVNESEHSLIRQLRLAALRDATDSFAESEHDVSMRTKAYWVELAHSFSKEHIMFVVELEGAACGSIYGIGDENNTNSVRVGGLWVSSDQRGQGFGMALLLAVLQWAKSEEFSAVRLWTSSSNTENLYSKVGFIFTSQSKSVPGACPFIVNEMILDLNDKS